jgi:alpha-amylase
MIGFDGEYVTTTSDVIYSDYQTTVMMKRQVMTVLSNAGSQSESYSITVPMRNTLVNTTGTNLIDIISCRTLVVGSTGDIVTSLVSGMPHVTPAIPWLFGSGVDGRYGSRVWRCR